MTSPTGQLFDNTTDFFNFISAPFEYDPDAPRSVEWLRFLDNIGFSEKERPNSKAFLQSGSATSSMAAPDLQKMALFLGESGSGKGAIIRLLTKMLGDTADRGTNTEQHH